jgi:acyl carrier protein
MTDSELSKIVTSTLFSVAPDLEGPTVQPDELFRDQFEIDSMDFLNFIIALHKRTGVEIPESDYMQLESLSGAVSYLRAKGVPG